MVRITNLEQSNRWKSLSNNETIRVLEREQTEIKMAEYQNLFTQVQVQAFAYPGVPLDRDRILEEGYYPFALIFDGLIGNAQIGPIYLGFLGVGSAICFAIAFSIIGMNYLAQVDYNVIEFVRQMFWLSLNPPDAKYGLGFPPLAEGGWFLMTGFFNCFSWWWFRMYRRVGYGHTCCGALPRQFGFFGFRPCALY